MKKNTVILVVFGMLSGLMVIESCTKDAHDITLDTSRTALDYAYECEEFFGPLPKFSCADAIEVPTTQNGIPVTFPG